MNRFSARLLLGLLGAAPIAACGDDDEPEPGQLGSSCDPSASAPCAGALVCSAKAAGGNVCTLPPGAVCQPDNEDRANGGCSEAAVCAVPEGGSEPLCLTTSGNVCDPENAHCADNLTCAEIEDGERRCFGKVVLQGDVTDTSDNGAIEGAHVIAVDEEGVAVTDVAETDAMGNYELEVPVVRRDDGTPLATTFTLKAAAQDYQPFPSGARVALPIEISEAEPVGDVYVVDNALTKIGLIPLEAGDRTTITGSVVALDGATTGNVGGVLVVAASDEAAFSGISDRSGHFTIFNVAAGDYEVRGYAADIQLDTEEVTVAGEPVEGVTLQQIDEPLATVTGTIQLVEAAPATSVILVVQDTFDADVVRGEAPRGLRAPRTGKPNVDGAFTIEGVPVGNYIVLAAYENDGAVRDPDTNIAGTELVPLEVEPGDTMIEISQSFKVTTALETIGPGVDAPEAVDGKPELVWADDSSEDWYDVRVFDAFGDEVWSALMLPPVSGSATASVQYEGPLEPGMYYQFRVSSWRAPGGKNAAPISTTEDLRGVFFLPAD